MLEEPTRIIMTLKTLQVVPMTGKLTILYCNPLSPRITRWRHFSRLWACNFCIKIRVISQQKTHFCLPTKVRFLNDVCLRQMMLATPVMTASPNDARLRHILWQTSHHCDRREQHHFERSEKHHIAAGDASFDILTIL